MPNIELVLDNVAQGVETPEQGEIFFSRIDFILLQLSLNQKTREKCALSLVGGRAAGLY